MNNVLILYPKYFLCFSKFERKVSNILKNMDDFCVITERDHSGFLKELLNSESNNVQISETNDFLDQNITHAIIFDDGEEFKIALQEMSNRSIPTRLIKIKITRVVNIKDNKEYANLKSTSNYEYIGRGSTWGNPYSMLEGDDRDEVIRKYEYDFDRGFIADKDQVYQLAGKKLGCFCKPAKCHGDVLANFLNGWDDGK